METRSGPEHRRPLAEATTRGSRRTVLDEQSLELGTRIRERRRALGLSLVRLAEVTDLSHPFLSQVERGHARPSVTSLRRIAAALDVDAGWLFGGAGERAPVELVRVEETQPWRVVEGQSEGTVRAFHAPGWASWFFDVIELPDTFGDEFGGPADVICYVLTGTMEIEVDGEVFSLGPSDAIFICAGYAARMRSTSGERTHFLVFGLSQQTS